MAAANGHEELVRLLIMKGAALEKSNHYDWTPLLHAARHGHTGNSQRVALQVSGCGVSFGLCVFMWLRDIHSRHMINPSFYLLLPE